MIKTKINSVIQTVKTDQLNKNQNNYFSKQGYLFRT